MAIPGQTLKILSKVKSPKFDDILRASITNGYNDYNQNFHNTGVEDVENLEKFCKILYTDWYSNMILNFDKFDGVKKRVAEALVKNAMFAPENVEKQQTATPFYNFFLYGYDKYFKGTNTRVGWLQEGSIIKKENFKDSFLHVFGYELLGQKRDVEEARLYLNLKGENLAKFAIEAYKKCKEQNLPFYFKFSIQDNRNDPFLFYTSYEKLPTYLQIIREIKTEKPELFEGAELINQNLGVIDGYIGYGDEPSVKDDSGETFSYNSVRKKAVNTIKRQLSKEIKERYKAENKEIIASTPKPMTFKEFCDFQVEQFAKKNLSSNVPQSENARIIKAMQEQFFNAYRKMILTGKPIEDITINFGQYKATLPFSQKNWLQLFMPNGQTSTEVRGVLARYTIFSGVKLNPDERLLMGVVRNKLIDGLRADLGNPDIQDKNRIKKFLDKVDIAPEKMDNVGKGLVILAAANFIESGKLQILDKDGRGYEYPEETLSIYEDIFGKENVSDLVAQQCQKYHISQDNICYNSETEEEIKQIMEQQTHLEF